MTRRDYFLNTLVFYDRLFEKVSESLIFIITFSIDKQIVSFQYCFIDFASYQLSEIVYLLLFLRHRNRQTSHCTLYKFTVYIIVWSFLHVVGVFINVKHTISILRCFVSSIICSWGNRMNYTNVAGRNSLDTHFMIMSCKQDMSLIVYNIFDILCHKVLDV